MSKAAATFRERDVRAMIRATEAAGKEVVGVEVARDGLIRIIVASNSALSTAAAEGRNPWDEDAKG